MKLITILRIIFVVVCSSTIFATEFIANIISRAFRQSRLEQSVEDANALHKFNAHLCRRLIALPVTDAFSPNIAHELHGKVQYSDKCSFPASLGTIIFAKPFEAPWLFEIKKVPIASEMEACNVNLLNVTEAIAYCSPLDFRSLENYIFMPEWLMEHLSIKPNDQVDIRFVRIKLASLVVIEPLSIERDRLLKAPGANPKQMLEHEISKFSTLTTGATIFIEIEKVRYPIRIKRLIAEGGAEVQGVRIQDSDVKVDIDRGYIDSLLASMRS